MNFWNFYRRSLLNICETAKRSNGDKYCHAFHPSQAYRDLQDMGGVKLKDLKDHNNAVGGSWGTDSWACLFVAIIYTMTMDC